jgi:hypothetical protein
MSGGGEGVAWGFLVMARSGGGRSMAEKRCCYQMKSRRSFSVDHAIFINVKKKKATIAQ